MQDEAGDDFEWTRQTGSTRSSGTGPTAGQTTSQGSDLPSRGCAFPSLLRRLLYVQVYMENGNNHECKVVRVYCLFFNRT